jgi:hypothetical protein
MTKKKHKKGGSTVVISFRTTLVKKRLDMICKDRGVGYAGLLTTAMELILRELEKFLLYVGGLIQAGIKQQSSRIPLKYNNLIGRRSYLLFLPFQGTESLGSI